MVDSDYNNYCNNNNGRGNGVTDIKDIEKRVDSLVAAYSSCLVEEKRLKQALLDFIDFDFGICNQQGEGFVIFADIKNERAAEGSEPHNARLKDCVGIIKSKGRLSVKDYIGISY